MASGALFPCAWESADARARTAATAIANPIPLRFIDYPFALIPSDIFSHTKKNPLQNNA
jgi:hypothetical protein